MKVYEITIKPITGFGTPLKGDTIFGHFCWQIAYDTALFGKNIDELLACYDSKPFAVFSSAYPKFCADKIYEYAFRTPDLPADSLFDLPNDKKSRISEIKKIKSKKWMIVSENKGITSFKALNNYLDDDKLLEKAKFQLSEETLRQIKRASLKRAVLVPFTQPRNTIDRLSGTTGEGRFAPFSIEQFVYYPETELALFIGIDEESIDIEQAKKCLERIGLSGFGKDASTGLGKFELLTEIDEIGLNKLGSESPNACYTLSPCVPEKGIYSEMYFSPFTRFGRHGDVLAKSSNPFKNPVIMADEGAIFKPKNKEVFNKPYIGTAVRNISLAEPNSVAQGYSLYIPVKVED